MSFWLRTFFTNTSLLQGGTSVLADAFLAPVENLTLKEQGFAFAFGVALQLVDDIQVGVLPGRKGGQFIKSGSVSIWLTPAVPIACQDVICDAADGQHTIFTIRVEEGADADEDIMALLQLLEKTLHPDYNPGQTGRTR